MVIRIRDAGEVRIIDLFGQLKIGGAEVALREAVQGLLDARVIAPGAMFDLDPNNPADNALVDAETTVVDGYFCFGPGLAEGRPQPNLTGRSECWGGSPQNDTRTITSVETTRPLATANPMGP